MKAEIRALDHAGINPGGDCGACCVGAIAGLSVREIYDIIPENGIHGFDYDDVIEILKRCEIIYNAELPINERSADARWKQFGDPSWFNWYSWFDNAYSKIHAGHIGIAQVVLHGTAPIDEHTNHWVLIIGAEYTDNNIGNTKKVWISCPTKGEFIIQAKDFLKNYGGYNAIWVKPLKITK